MNGIPSLQITIYQNCVHAKTLEFWRRPRGTKNFESLQKGH